MRLKRLFLGIMLFTGITGAGAANAAPEDISALCFYFLESAGE